MFLNKNPVWIRLIPVVLATVCVHSASAAVNLGLDVGSVLRDARFAKIFAERKWLSDQSKLEDPKIQSDIKKRAARIHKHLQEEVTNKMLDKSGTLTQDEVEDLRKRAISLAQAEALFSETSHDRFVYSVATQYVLENAKSGNLRELRITLQRMRSENGIDWQLDKAGEVIATGEGTRIDTIVFVPADKSK